MNGKDVVMRGAETDKICSEKCLVLGDYYKKCGGRKFGHESQVFSGD